MQGRRLRFPFRLERVWVEMFHWHFDLKVGKIYPCWSNLIGSFHDNISLLDGTQSLPSFTANQKTFHILSSFILLAFLPSTKHMQSYILPIPRYLQFPLNDIPQFDLFLSYFDVC